METIIDDVAQAVARQRRQRDVPSRATVRVPLFALPEALRLCARGTTKQVLHIYPVESEEGRSKAFDLAIWRQVAQGTASVERLFVVPHHGFADHAIKEMIAQDELAGIKCHLLTISALPLEAVGSPTKQLLIIDDVLVLSADDQDGGPGLSEAGWICSTDPSTLDRARELWSFLAEFRDEGEAIRPDAILEEPLVSSADLVHGVANVLCSGDHVDHEGCSWYHGAWQYLRLLDLVSTPTWHDLFYRTALQNSFKANPNARVLISGTADYSLLAYVLDAADAVGAAARVVVVDQCATPLFACRWFAKRRGAIVETVQSDILEYCRTHASEFNLVCSDAFLTRFDGDTVGNVVDGWKTVLKDSNSRVITTIRLHGKTTVVRDDEKAVRDFVERARSRVPRWSGFLRISGERISALSEAYIRRMVSNKHGSEADLESLLGARGLQILHREIGNVPGELYPTAYLRVIARRA